MNIRRSIRILLLNPENKLLLMRVVDPTITDLDRKIRPAFWCTIGGSLEPGEVIEDALARELYEETGLTLHDVTLGPIVWHGKHEMILSGTLTLMEEYFIVARTDKNNISTNNLTDTEKKVVTNLNWLAYDEIINHHEEIYPAILKTHLPSIIAGNYPTLPLEVDLSIKLDQISI